MWASEYTSWKSKQQSNSLKDARRPSTTIDANGCVVQKGFLIPSPTSSFDSRSGTSSPALEDPGTPATPIPSPPIGFRRPCFSFSSAHEVGGSNDLNPSPQDSLSKDGERVAGGRPILKRSQTWQTDPSSCPEFPGTTGLLDSEDLQAISCKSESVYDLKVTGEYFARRSQTMKKFGIREVDLDQLRRDQRKGPAVNSQAREPFKPLRIGKKRELRAEKKSKKIRTSELRAHIEGEGENAIASDDEEDNGECTFTRGRIAAQRKGSSYAMRRARSDKLAAERSQQQQQQQLNALMGDDSTLAARVRFLKICSSDQVESAIGSDDEEDDGVSPGKDQISRALSLAIEHKSINKRLPAPACEATERTRGQSVCFKVDTAASQADREMHDTLLETPREIKSFDRLSPIPKRDLRPSRSQPNPVKGVLKKSGSVPKPAGNSPPKHVVTTVRCSSTPATRSRAEVPAQ